MHIEVHLETALGAAGAIFQFMPCETENELPSAQNASEALLAAINMTIFIYCF
jgi:hypothetical protein